MVLLLILLLSSSFLAVDVVARDDGDADPPKYVLPVSMGQPPRIRTAVGVETGYVFRDDDPAWRVFGNVVPRGRFPHLGIDLMMLEVGVGRNAGEWRGDIGYYVRVPFVRVGAEFSVPEDKFGAVFTLQYALRRGGLFGGGEELRVDYRTNDDGLLVGVVFNEPFRKYRKTRPVKKYEVVAGAQPLPSSPETAAGQIPPDLEQAMQRIEHSIEWLDKLLTPRFISGSVAEKADDYRAHIRVPGHTFAEEDSTYHRELADAFAIAAGSDSAEGDRLARAAEAIIFDRVIVPYDRMFGENKKPRGPTGYVAQAGEAFDSVVAARAPVASVDAMSPMQTALASAVFRRTLVAIENAANESRKRWKTTNAFWLQRAQLTWLPLNYGLRPDGYDTQAEWDEVVSRLTGEAQTNSNSIEYLINEQFHPQLKRMINETEDYQVLVIHDFQGRSADGDTDVWGWDMVTEGYMKALTEAVRAIDRGERERLPQYLLYIDQNFYTTNKCFQIVTYMENLYASDTVELRDADVKIRVEAAHRAMITAIDSSRAFGSMDEKTRRDLFKVHVSVTNPWDPTFALDMTMRDHRKFAFRDVFEDDPSRGVGILTGTGVGGHYHPPTWEDRAMLIKGPALLDLKRAAENLCLGQGFSADEVPEWLRERPLPEDYAERCETLRARGWRAPVRITTNATGYGRKVSTVMRAAIYNLAPRGSVLVAIDSLWLNDFWAGMFICAALRGAHVYAVAPSPLNAPAAQNSVMFLACQNLELLFEGRKFLSEDLRKSGGRIHVGLYAHDYSVDDVVERFSALMEGLEAHPYLLEDFPLSQSVYDAMRGLLDREKAQTPVEEPQREEIHPFVHMKTQFFGTRLGMQILRQEEWNSIIATYAEIRRKQAAGQTTEGLTPTALAGYDAGAGTSSLVRDFEAYLGTLPADVRQNVIYAFTIGSMNQDRRGMLSDGEILASISGYHALIGVLDMVLILGISTWPADASNFDDIFPQPTIGTTFQKLFRYFQDMF